MIDLFQKDGDDVLEVIEKWRPPQCAGEREYEGALYRHLNAAFPEAVFHQQYVKAKTRADIYVDFGATSDGGDEVAIEVKANLSERDEFHRLFGQMFEYLELWKADAILVLCGNCDPAMVKLSRLFVDHLNRAYWTHKARLAVVP